MVRSRQSLKRLIRKDQLWKVPIVRSRARAKTHSRRPHRTPAAPTSEPSSPQSRSEPRSALATVHTLVGPNLAPASAKLCPVNPDSLASNHSLPGHSPAGPRGDHGRPATTAARRPRMHGDTELAVVQHRDGQSDAGHLHGCGRRISAWLEVRLSDQRHASADAVRAPRRRSLAAVRTRPVTRLAGSWLLACPRCWRRRIGTGRPGRTTRWRSQACPGARRTLGHRTRCPDQAGSHR